MLKYFPVILDLALAVRFGWRCCKYTKTVDDNACVSGEVASTFEVLQSYKNHV